jgi:hypothetical protein
MARTSAAIWLRACVNGLSKCSRYEGSPAGGRDLRSRDDAAGPVARRIAGSIIDFEKVEPFCYVRMQLGVYAIF